MKKISEPGYLEYAMYYENYIRQVHKEISVLDQLKQQSKDLVALVKSLPEEKLITPYAEGKWSIKDLIQHMTDSERVFVYRAMRFARNDKSPLPFFDENAFAQEAAANKTPSSKLLKEYLSNRQATLAFFNNQSAAVLKRAGIASNYTMSVRACAWIICGHEIHHTRIIRERYL